MTVLRCFSGRIRVRSGGAYANFPDADLPDEDRAYWGANLDRVRRVKEKYDPERVFG